MRGRDGADSPLSQALRRLPRRLVALGAPATAAAVAVLGVTPAAPAGAASAGPASTGTASAGPVGASPVGVRASSVRWHEVTSTNAGFLTSLVAPARGSIWALGTGYVPSHPGKGFPLGLHWNGRSWSRASFPTAIGTTGIGCAGSTSASDVWAFAGTSSNASSARTAGALRLVNGRWKLVRTFPAGIVTGCLVISATEVWVFGDAHVAPGTGTWHLHGRTWTHLGFHGFILDGASAISASAVWGQGETSFGVPVVARWDGHSWTRNAQLANVLPKTGTNDHLGIGGLTAISDHDVWLRIWDYHFQGSTRTDSFFVVHWNGRSWFKVGPTNPGYYLPGAVRDARGGWWSYLPTDQWSHMPSGVRHLVSGHWVKTTVQIPGCPGSQPYLLSAVGGSATMLGLQGCPTGTAVLAHGPIG